MTPDDRDEALRERFQRLRAEETSSAPDFQEMLARAEAEALADRPHSAADSPLATDGQASVGARAVPISGARRGRLRFALTAGTLAAAALAGIMLLRPDAGDQQFEALVTAYANETGVWRSPTDNLLAVPGMELLNTVPTVGWPYGSAPEGAGGEPPPDSDVMG